MGGDEILNKNLISLRTCSFCGKSENEVKRLIEGPSVNICNYCIDACNEQMKEERLEVNEDFRHALKPHEIVSELDKYIIGQTEAKKLLSVAVYNHYKRINIESNTNIQKTNIMLIGPTGSGKTYLMKTLSKILDVPLAIADATSLTEAGYVGEDVESILAKLIRNADGSIKRAEKGIIYIDEIDKLARKDVDGRGNYKDVGGEGVQQALLKIIEGAEIDVSLEHNRGIPGRKVTINTENILFVVGGAFPGLDKIVSKKYKNKSMGFTQRETENKNKKIDLDNILSQVTSEDVAKFGFIPEFLGRVPVIVTLNKLNKEELKKILIEPKDALLRQYRELLKVDGVDLEFSDDAIEYIADSAMKKDIGARGLRGVIEKQIYELMYEAPKQQNLEKYIITRKELEKRCF